MARKKEAAFEIIVRENTDMLITYLRAVVRDTAAVDDLFQETMLIAWRKLDKCDTSRPFGPWLRAIAANLVMAHYRKRKRDMMLCDESVLDYLDQQIQHISERPGDTWEERIAALRQCIESLPEIHRDAVRLRYIEGDSARDVATHLKISLEALKKRLQRARNQLLQCMQTKGTLPESAS